MNVKRIELQGDRIQHLVTELMEHGLSVNPRYTGWGLEIYDNVESQTQAVLDWNIEPATLVVKKGFS